MMSLSVRMAHLRHGPHPRRPLHPPPQLTHNLRMARISYVDVDKLDDAELRGYMEHARRFGTPRPETQAIRSHVPAVARAFSRARDRLLRSGVVEHSLKQLRRA